MRAQRGGAFIDGGDMAAARGRILPGIFAGADAHHLDFLQQRAVERHGGHPADKADDEVAATASQRFHRRQPERAAHGIENHVDVAPINRRIGAIDNDAMMRTRRPGDGQPGARRGHRDHLCTFMRRQRHRSEPHAAAGAGDEHALAARQPTTRHQPDPGGERADGERRRFGVIKARRHRPHASGGERDAFSKAAAAAADDDTLAKEVRRPCPRRNHHATGFGTGNERQFGAELVTARQHQQIGKVERGARNRDGHFARCGRQWLGPVRLQPQAGAIDGEVVANKSAHDALCAWPRPAANAATNRVAAPCPRCAPRQGR